MGIADARNAEEFTTHPEGKGFVFQIQSAEEKMSKAGNPIIEMVLVNTDNSPDKPPFRIWPRNETTDFTLRKLIDFEAIAASGMKVGRSECCTSGIGALIARSPGAYEAGRAGSRLV